MTKNSENSSNLGNGKVKNNSLVNSYTKLSRPRNYFSDKTCEEFSTISNLQDNLATDLSINTYGNFANKLGSKPLPINYSLIEVLNSKRLDLRDASLNKLVQYSNNLDDWMDKYSLIEKGFDKKKSSLINSLDSKLGNDYNLPIKEKIEKLDLNKAKFQNSIDKKIDLGSKNLDNLLKIYSGVESSLNKKLKGLEMSAFCGSDAGNFDSSSSNDFSNYLAVPSYTLNSLKISFNNNNLNLNNNKTGYNNIINSNRPNRQNHSNNSNDLEEIPKPLEIISDNTNNLENNNSSNNVNKNSRNTNNDLVEILEEPALVETSQINLLEEAKKKENEYIKSLDSKLFWTKSNGVMRSYKAKADVNGKLYEGGKFYDYKKDLAVIQ